MKPNIVILTVGRSGSTILTQMLGKLGWNLPYDVDQYAEPLAVRDINERLIRKMPIDDEEFQAAVGMHQEPWVIKDPRFCWTLKQWRSWLDGCLLLWLRRDLKDVEISLKRKNWGRETTQGMTLRGAPLPKIEYWCETHFRNWTGPKLELRFEDIREAAGLFDVTRGL